MTLTLLLDLDDTLLNTNLEAFVPAYFKALSKHLAGRVDPGLMLSAMVTGTRLMTENEDPSRTLQDVFESSFYPAIGMPKEELDHDLEYFYDEIFPSLGTVTSVVEAAKPFVEWAQARRYRVAIATDPLFPRKATLERLRWAGFDPLQFELVSSFENFHFSKTHPAYYAEVLGQLGWPDGPVLMVGNDLGRDILPSQRLGLATYQITSEPPSGSGPEEDGRGLLSDLRLWLERCSFSALIPSFNSIDSVMSILSASPASLAAICGATEGEQWLHKPAPGDWALTEVVCHLRDTEREIHHMQVDLLMQRGERFVPRPDTAVWASQRNYLTEDGPTALNQFLQARRETIDRLKQARPDDWSREVRHAIFGPTNFLEVVGFMAEHDRLHIQQAWNLVR